MQILHLLKFYLRGGSLSINGSGNVFRIHPSYVSNCKVVIDGSNNSIEIGPGTSIQNTEVHLQGNNQQLHFGERCLLKKGEIWLVGDNSSLIIQKQATIQGAHFAAVGGRSITIGEHAMLSYDIDIRTTDHHPIFDKVSNEHINPDADVQIGNEVWIGAHAIILKGVNIGSGSVIGTASIVTKSFGENQIIVGNPAKAIRDNIYWKRK